MATVIDDLLVKSRENNPVMGITGVLCLCDDNAFMQVLEGGREEVEPSLLARDSRHAPHRRDAARVLGITERCFTNWRMGRVDLDRINAGMVLKSSETPHLDPFAFLAGWRLRSCRT